MALTCQQVKRLEVRGASRLHVRQVERQYNRRFRLGFAGILDMVHLPADAVGQDDPLDAVKQRVLRRGEQVAVIRSGANRADANQHGNRATGVNREIINRLTVVQFRRHLRVAVEPEQVRQQVDRQRGGVRTTGFALPGNLEQRLEPA